MYQNFAPYMDSTFMRSPIVNVPPVAEIKLARAYVPDQPLIGLFPLGEGLKKGTIFPNLSFPYPEKSKE